MAGKRWGPWTLDHRHACLVYDGETYFVSIDEMTTAAQTLDWIFHMAETSWVTPADIGHLVIAIEEILGRDMAGCGRSKRIAPLPRMRAFANSLAFRYNHTDQK